MKKDPKILLIDQLFMFLSIICLWIPNSYSYIFSGYIYAMIRWLQYGVAILFVFFVVITKKYNKMFCFSMILSLILIFSTVINKGNPNKCLNYVAPMIGTVSMITYYSSTGKIRQLLKTMRHVLYIYIGINFITYFMFPRGLYVTELVTSLSNKRNTFLGNRNAYKFYGLLLIFISFTEDHIFFEKPSKNKTMMAFITALLMECMGKSLSGMITIVFVTILYVLVMNLKIFTKIEPGNYFYAAIGILVFLIFFASIGKYSQLISYVFNGNVTFSNRVKIWTASRNLIISHPLFGIGTQSTSKIVHLIYNLHSHNQFLEIALRGGVTCLIMYILCIYTSFKKLSSWINKKYASYISICLFAAIIMNMVEVETYSYAIISYFCSFIYCLDIGFNACKKEVA